MAWNHSGCCIRMLITLICGHARCGLSFQPGEFSSRVSWHLLISSWEPEPGGTLLKDSLSFTVRGACVVFSRDLGLLCPSPGWCVHPQGGVSIIPRLGTHGAASPGPAVTVPLLAHPPVCGTWPSAAGTCTRYSLCIPTKVSCDPWGAAGISDLCRRLS